MNGSASPSPSTRCCPGCDRLAVAGAIVLVLRALAPGARPVVARACRRVLLAALANPSLVEEQRKPTPTWRSWWSTIPSQRIGDRRQAPGRARR